MAYSTPSKIAREEALISGKLSDLEINKLMEDVYNRAYKLASKIGIKKDDMDIYKSIDAFYGVGNEEMLNRPLKSKIPKTIREAIAISSIYGYNYAKYQVIIREKQ